MKLLITFFFFLIFNITQLKAYKNFMFKNKNSNLMKNNIHMYVYKQISFVRHND